MKLPPRDTPKSGALRAEGDTDPDDDDLDADDTDHGEGPVTVERLSNMMSWELYRFFDEDAAATLCTIALRPGEENRLIEYGLWRYDRDSDEPGATGTVELHPKAETWDDVAREDALRQIAYRYEEDLGVAQSRLVVRIDGPPDDADDEDDDHEDEDDEADDE